MSSDSVYIHSHRAVTLCMFTVTGAVTLCIFTVTGVVTLCIFTVTGAVTLCIFTVTGAVTLCIFKVTGAVTLCIFTVTAAVTLCIFTSLLIKKAVDLLYNFLLLSRFNDYICGNFCFYFTLRGIDELENYMV